MKYFLLSVFLLFTYNSFAQWNQLSGPEGANFGCIEKFSFGIFCGVETGAYISSDEGLTWQKVNSIPEHKISDILNVNDTVIVLYDNYVSGSPSSGLYSMVSFDQGVTWSTPAFIENSSNWPSSKLHHQGISIFAVGSQAAYISHDYGQSWTIVASPNSDPIQSYNFYGKYLLVSTLNTSPHHAEHYISWDGNLNWQLVDTIYTYYSVMIDSAIIYTYYDTTNYKSIRTFDFGQTWDTVFSSTGFDGAALYTENNILYRYTNQYDFFSSMDYGSTWIPCDPPHGLDYRQGIPLSNGDELAIKNNAGLVHYITPSDTFYTPWTGILSQTSSMLRSFNNVLYANVNYGFYSSTDAGKNWNKLNTMITGIQNMRVSGDTIVCVNSSDLTRSIDNGLTWDTAITPQWSYLDVPGLELLDGRLYYSGQASYYSDDLGDTWIHMPGAPDSTATCSSFIIQNGYFREFKNDLYIVSNDGKIAKLDQGTNTWINPHCFWSTGAHNGNYLYVVDSFLVMTGRRTMERSSDGINWSVCTITGIPIDQSGALVVPRSLVSIEGLWIGSCGSYGIWASSDLGNTWFPISTPSFSPRGITTQNNILYAGSGGKGIWKRDGVFHNYSGRVYVDLNQNNIYDIGEQTQGKIILKTLPSSWVTATDSMGIYSLTCDATGDAFRPNGISPFIHYSPTQYILDTVQFTNLDFAIDIDSLVSDFSIDLTNVSIFRAGRPTQLIATLTNHGTINQAGLAAIYFPPTLLQFNTATPSPDYTSNDTLYWHIDSLDVFESFTISIEVTTSILVMLNDSIVCFAQVSPILDDAFLADNTFYLKEFVRGSYDPNDKTCLQGDQITHQELANNKSLDYLIRFQNTGNAEAITAYIIDTLSNYLDWSTLKVISSSHPFSLQIDNGGVVKFDFGSIHLADSVHDEPHSHGFIKYNIEARKPLQIGNTITNSADIFFDFNPGVKTNTTSTLVIDPIIMDVIVRNYKNDINVEVFPNPASDNISVRLNGFDKEKTIRIYNSMGKLMASKISDTEIVQLSLYNFENGFYVGEILSNSGERIANFRMIVDKK